MDRTWIKHITTNYSWELSEIANQWAAINNVIIIGISSYKLPNGYAIDLLVKKDGDDK
jgi:hypothetical protein